MSSHLDPKYWTLQQLCISLRSRRLARRKGRKVPDRLCWEVADRLDPGRKYLPAQTVKDDFELEDLKDGERW